MAKKMQIVEKQLFAFKMLPIWRREKTRNLQQIYAAKKKQGLQQIKIIPFMIYNKLIRFEYSATNMRMPTLFVCFNPRSPWERSKQKKICTYGAFWRTWGSQ